MKTVSAFCPSRRWACSIEVSEERISSGVPRLDAMLGGEGFYRGSTILVSGTAGTGKTSLAAHFVDAACRRGERCLYFSFEESPGQIIRNMRSIGLNLEQWIQEKSAAVSFQPGHALWAGNASGDDPQDRSGVPAQGGGLDPVGSLIQAGNRRDAHTMLIRLIDFLKQRGITAFLTNLTSGGDALEKTDVEISSIVDTWLFVRDIELNGERNRALYVLKSRGMAHSNQLREFLLTEHGVDLLDVYVGPEGVLTGSSRLSQEAREKAAAAGAPAGSASASSASARASGKHWKRASLALRKEFEVEEEEAATAPSGGRVAGKIHPDQSRSHGSQPPEPMWSESEPVRKGGRGSE